MTGDGFALVEDGGTALVELAGAAELTGERLAGGAELTGERLAAAAASGAAVVVLGGRRRGSGRRRRRRRRRCSKRSATTAGWAAPTLLVLCPLRAPGALALHLRDAHGARLVGGAPFVLDALGFDARMRAARALIVGEARLDRATLLESRVAGEIAVRARQSGVPSHAVVATNAIDRFDARILDVQAILEASTVAALEAAGQTLAAYL